MMPIRKATDTQAEAAWQHELDLALQALNDAEAPAGMHERLQRRVPLAAGQRSSRKGRIATSAVFGVVMTLACVCLLVALGLHLSHANRTKGLLAEGAIPQRLPPLVAPPFTASTHATPAAGFHLAVPTQLPIVKKVRQMHLPMAAILSSPTEAQLDAQALADTQAPSHSAPILELTAQERQIRLMLRRGERHQLAELSPLRVESRQQTDRAELHHFFDPPPPSYPLPLPYIEQLDTSRKQLVDGVTSSEVTPR